MSEAMPKVAPFTGVHGPLIIAHRGGALEAPENTLPAVKHGVQSGADWVEIDVTLSADDEVVVIHDDTVDRTTNGRGKVRNLTWAQLRALEAGRPTWTATQRARLALFEVEPPSFGDRFAGTRIPKLQEVLAVPGVRLMIEMKTIEAQKVGELARKVVETVQRSLAWERVLVGSFDTRLLWAAHDVDPSMPLIGIADNEGAIEAMLGLPIRVLAVRVDLVSTAVKMAGGKVAIWAWTAYSPQMAKAAVEQGAHGVITDVPAQVVAALRPEPELYITADDKAKPDPGPGSTDASP